MSDVSQGPGWWQASDAKWYPPEQAAPQGPPAGAPAGYGQPAAAGYGAPAMGAPGELVPWGTRVLATLVDSGILLVGYIVVFILVLIFGAIADVLGVLVLIVGSLALFAASFYFTYLTGEKGQSPGKKIMGIKVVGEQTGQPIGGGLGIVRGLAHVLDGFCMIGYLFPLWDAKKQTFADKIMTTVVVPGPKESFGPDIFKP